MKLGTFIMGCALALLACTLAGCDDRLEVRQVHASRASAHPMMNVPNFIVSSS